MWTEAKAADRRKTLGIKMMIHKLNLQDIDKFKMNQYSHVVPNCKVISILPLILNYSSLYIYKSNSALTLTITFFNKYINIYRVPTNVLSSRYFMVNLMKPIKCSTYRYFFLINLVKVIEVV